MEECLIDFRKKYPKTYEYVTKRRVLPTTRCNACGRPIIKNNDDGIAHGKPFQCMSCDWDLKEKDVYVDSKHPASNQEIIDLYENTLILLLDE